MDHLDYSSFNSVVSRCTVKPGFLKTYSVLFCFSNPPMRFQQIAKAMKETLRGIKCILHGLRIYFLSSPKLKGMNATT